MLTGLWVEKYWKSIMMDIETMDLNAPLGHCGMIAVVGRANVGKSTLVNALLEEKISIVSPVCQTTRHLVRGILTEDEGQLVFLDTPGVHKAGNDLGRIMNRIARASVDGADVVLLMFDVSSPPRLEDEGWVKSLSRCDEPVHVLLNKIDSERRFEEDYKTLWDTHANGKAAQWSRVSAAEKQGLDELKKALFQAMPVGPLLFPEEIVSDYPQKLALADLIREKLFERLRQELPHAIAVRVDELEENEDGSWQVDAVIFVNKHSQKQIVIGHKGRQLRAVKRSSEREILEQYERTARVHLWVKVHPNWNQNFWLLRQLGHVL